MNSIGLPQSKKHSLCQFWRGRRFSTKRLYQNLQNECFLCRHDSRKTPTVWTFYNTHTEYKSKSHFEVNENVCSPSWLVSIIVCHDLCEFNLIYDSASHKIIRSVNHCHLIDLTDDSFCSLSFSYAVTHLKKKKTTKKITKNFRRQSVSVGPVRDMQNKRTCGQYSPHKNVWVKCWSENIATRMAGIYNHRALPLVS